MIPQLQRNVGFDGQHGDCHRTCVAMILNMHRDDVPHFMASCPPNLEPDDPRSVAAEAAELRWLAKRRLTAVNIPFPGEASLTEMLELTDTLTHGAPVVLGCTTLNGANHSVVIKDGVVYNPNAALSAMAAGPMRDGFWWLTIYSVGMRWRSHLLRDRVCSWFRLAMERCTR